MPVGELKVCSPESRRSKKHHVLLPLEKPKFGQALDLLTCDGWLEEEVELLKSLRYRKSGEPHGCLEPSVVAKGNPGGK
jgi:hypothetical protein